MAIAVYALLLFCFSALAIIDAGAQQPADTLYEITGLWSGQFLHVNGVKPKGRSLAAEKVELGGPITASVPGAKLLRIGPVEVQWSDSTLFEGTPPESLATGTVIAVTGRIVSPGRLLASSISTRLAVPDSSSSRLVGAVTGIKRNADGSASFKILGVDAFLPGDVYLQLRHVLPEAEQDDDPSWDIRGEYEVKLDYRKNFALTRGRRDDLFRLDQEFQLRWAYSHKDWLSLLVEGKILGEHQLYTGGGGRRSEFDPERGETWVRLDKLFGRDLSLKAGRQNFEEPRRWWWDDDLDAIAVRYRHDSWFVELGAARELLRKSLRDNFIEPENEGVTRVLARANWLYAKDHGLDLFFLHHNDRSATPPVGGLVRANREDPSDARLWWGGVRATGNLTGGQYGDLSYWADLAMVSGQERLLELVDEVGNRKRVTSRRGQRVRGWAIDLGGRWDSQFPGRPLFTLGYALGSGDKNPEQGMDRAFRQTGLQSNDEEFRTYGELLRPELSNLSIPVLAVQFPIFSKSHVEFAYRYFRQQHAAPFLRDARIEADPDGRNKNVGQEWMLYSIIKQWKNIEIEMVGAAFRAGGAYGALAGKMAYSLFTKVTYEF